MSGTSRPRLGRRPTATLVTEPKRLDSIPTAFEQAYGWHLTCEDPTQHGMADMMRPGEVNTDFVHPTIVFASGNGEPFSKTRYHFD